MQNEINTTRNNNEYNDDKDRHALHHQILQAQLQIPFNKYHSQ